MSERKQCKHCGREIYYCEKEHCDKWHHHIGLMKYHTAKPEELEDLPLEQLDG